MLSSQDRVNDRERGIHPKDTTMNPPRDKKSPNLAARRGSERLRDVFVFGVGQVQFRRADTSAASAARDDSNPEGNSPTHLPADSNRKHPRFSHGSEALSPSRLAISRESFKNAPPLKRRRSDPATDNDGAAGSLSSAASACVATAEEDRVGAAARSQSLLSTAGTGRKRARSKTTTSVASTTMSGRGNDQPTPTALQPPGAARMSDELSYRATDRDIDINVAASEQIAAGSSSLSSPSRPGNLPVYTQVSGDPRSGVVTTAESDDNISANTGAGADKTDAIKPRRSATGKPPSRGARSSCSPGALSKPPAVINSPSEAVIADPTNVKKRRAESDNAIPANSRARAGDNTVVRKSRRSATGKPPAVIGSSLKAVTGDTRKGVERSEGDDGLSASSGSGAGNPAARPPRRSPVRQKSSCGAKSSSLTPHPSAKSPSVIDSRSTAVTGDTVQRTEGKTDCDGVVSANAEAGVGDKTAKRKARPAAKGKTLSRVAESLSVVDSPSKAGAGDPVNGAEGRTASEDDVSADPADGAGDNTVARNWGHSANSKSPSNIGSPSKVVTEEPSNGVERRVECDDGVSANPGAGISITAVGRKSRRSATGKTPSRGAKSSYRTPRVLTRSPSIVESPSKRSATEALCVIADACEKADTRRVSMSTDTSGVLIGAGDAVDGEGAVVAAEATVDDGQNRTTKKIPRQSRSGAKAGAAVAAKKQAGQRNGDTPNGDQSSRANPPSRRKRAGKRGVRADSKGAGECTSDISIIEEGSKEALTTTVEEDLSLVLTLFQEQEGLLAVRARVRKEIFALQAEEDELRGILNLPAAHPVSAPPSPSRTVHQSLATLPVQTFATKSKSEPKSRATIRKRQATTSQRSQSSQSTTLGSKYPPARPQPTQAPVVGAGARSDVGLSTATQEAPDLPDDRPSGAQMSENENGSADGGGDGLSRLGVMALDIGDGDDDDLASAAPATVIHHTRLDSARLGQPSTHTFDGVEAHLPGQPNKSEPDNTSIGRVEDPGRGRARGRGSGRGAADLRSGAASHTPQGSSRGRGKSSAASSEALARARDYNGVTPNGRDKQSTKFSQIGADAQVKFRPSGRGGLSRRGMGRRGGRGGGCSSTGSGDGGRGLGSLGGRGSRRGYSAATTSGGRGGGSKSVASERGGVVSSTASNRGKSSKEMIQEARLAALAASEEN